MKRIKTQPTIPVKVNDYYRDNFSKPYPAMSAVLGGAVDFWENHPGAGLIEDKIEILNHALSMHRAMFSWGRRLVRGKLTADELTVCVSLMNATHPADTLPGETLLGKAEDILPGETPNGMDRDQLDMLVYKLRCLGVFERTYLEIWAWAYWYAYTDSDKDLADYIQHLV